MTLDADSNTILLKGLAEKWNEEEFFGFCLANGELRIEKDARGNVMIMSPAGFETSHFELLLGSLILAWNVKASKPGQVFGSSAGYRLPDHSMRSPDTSWVSAENLAKLGPEDRKRFPQLAPDFAAEIRSPSDSLAKLKAKMNMWIDNGVKLAWLIDPGAQNAWIYRANGEIELVEGVDAVLTGEERLPGLEVPLSLFVSVEG